MPNLYNWLVLLLIINAANCAFLNGLSLEAYNDDFRTTKGSNYWLAKVAQEFKANVVEIQQVYIVDNSTSTDIYPSANAITDDSLKSGATFARNQGLQVIFKFSLMCENGESSSAIGKTFTAAQWNAFFNNYVSSVQYFANLLGNMVDYFVIGGELQNSHVSYASRWTSIVNGVRGVPFSGKIGYYTSTFDKNVDIGNFVSALDFVYVSNKAITLTTTSSPTVADLKSAWNVPLASLRGLSCSYNKTFIIDLFYPSVSSAVTRTNVTDTSGLPVDLNAQAVAFQGAYASLSEHSWLGGIIASRLSIQDPVGAYLPGPGLNCKPALNVVRNWMSTLQSSSPPCPLNSLYNLDSTTEQSIYTDSLGSNLKDESVNYATAPNYADTTQSHTGTSSISVSLNEGGSLQIRWLPVLMVNTYPFFEFYIRSTSVTKGTLYFSLGVSGGITTEQVLIENTASMNGSVISGTWKRVLIDVEQLIGPQQFSGRTSWDNLIITYYSGNSGSTSGTFFIDDIKMYGPSIPSCPGQCNYPNRKGCIGAAGCGYCGSTQSCSSGDAFSPASGDLCYSWLYNDPSIRVLPTSGPDNSPCDQYDSCYTCTDDELCGWCGVSNQCSMKNNTKPICGKCTDYFVTIAECKTVNTKPSQRLMSFYPLKNSTSFLLSPINTTNVLKYLKVFPQYGSVEINGLEIESPYNNPVTNLTYHYVGATVGLDQMGYTVYDNLRGITFMNVTINFNLSYLVFGILPTTGGSTSTTGEDALKSSGFVWKSTYTIAVAVLGGIVVLIAIFIPVGIYCKNQPRLIKIRKPKKKEDKRLTDLEMSQSTSPETSRGTVPQSEYNLNLASTRPSPGVSRETNTSFRPTPSNGPSNEYNLNTATSFVNSREAPANSSFMIPRQNTLDNGSRGVRPPRPGNSPYGGTKQGYSWEIQYSELEFGDIVGSGSFGQVYKGNWRKATVAIKVVLNTSEEDRKAFEKEADLMKAIRPHSHVVGFQGLCVYQGQVMIVTEFCERGDLRTYISKNAQIDRKSTIKWLRGIAAGMLHISSEGLVHRDLAARNVLLSGNLEAKITDFGMSRLVESSEKGGKTESNVGPLKWMAPESLIDNIYSMKSDVYSFGVLIWEVLCRSDPYPNLTGAQVAAKVGQGQLTLEKPSIFPEIGDVMVKCLQRDPTRRPDFAQICDLLPQQ